MATIIAPLLTRGKLSCRSCLVRWIRTSAAVMEKKIAVPEVKAYCLRCLAAVGCKPSHAEALANVLVAADYRGHFSHGLNRLEMYINDLSKKLTVSDKEPVIIRETAATALVDGNNLLGPVVGNFCMDLAISKAKQTGVGWVAAKGSNHFGIAGWYAERAVHQGLLGMSFTNTSPLLVPTRAKKSFLGTNPLSVAAPAKGGDYFLLDMATTAVAVGKIEVQRRKGEPIPKGWAVDKDGTSTTDPNAVLSPPGGSLMPLGGEEVNSGYKGYGLCMMVEVLCGILSGSTYGPNIRKWIGATDTVADLGHCFIALDPKAFAPGFEDRMSDLLNLGRNLEPMDCCKPVLVPGDPERCRMHEVDQRGGIMYHNSQVEASANLAKRLNVEPMPIMC